MTKVLAGCRVVEHGIFITGPYTGMLLADLGAEVIKVERPDGGDPFRNFEGGLYGPQFQAYNRNKKSIALDLKQDNDRAVFRDLIRTADVYIQNFRPGVAEELGAGAKALRKLNPRLVYCAISGFGPDGPYAKRPTYDTVAQAMSGWLSMFVQPDNPRVSGPAISDTVTGLYAAIGILGALHERQKTGRGRLVEVSMLEATINFGSEPFHDYLAKGRVAGPRDRARIAQSYAFACADGKLLVLHLSSLEKFWKALLSVVERPELADDPRFAKRMDRIHNHQAISDILKPIFATRPRADWLDLLEKANVPHSPILNIDEVVADPQVKHLGLERRMQHPTEGKLRTMRRPIVYDSDRRSIPVEPPPVLDEHGAAIRKALARAAKTAGKKSVKKPPAKKTAKPKKKKFKKRFKR